jgi:hypothetical protein
MITLYPLTSIQPNATCVTKYAHKQLRKKAKVLASQNVVQLNPNKNRRYLALFSLLSPNFLLPDLGQMVLSYTGTSIDVGPLLAQVQGRLTFLRSVQFKEVTSCQDEQYSLDFAAVPLERQALQDLSQRCINVGNLALACRYDCFGDVLPLFDKLESLTLHHASNIEDEDVERLKNSCTKLQRFEILTHMDSALEISDLGILHLSSLPLTSLTIRGFSSISDEGLAHLARCPITTLEISGGDITDEGARLASKSKTLTSVNFSHCRILTHVSLSFLLSNSHLRALSLNSMDQSFKMNSAVVSIPAAPQLQTFCLQYSNISNAGLALFPSRFPNLTHLDLSKCHCITDAGLAHVKKLPLKRLETTGCLNLDDVIREMAKLKLS